METRIEVKNFFVYREAHALSHKRTWCEPSDDFTAKVLHQSALFPLPARTDYSVSKRANVLCNKILHSLKQQASYIDGLTTP